MPRSDLIHEVRSPWYLPGFARQRGEPYESLTTIPVGGGGATVLNGPRIYSRRPFSAEEFAYVIDQRERELRAAAAAITADGHRLPQSAAQFRYNILDPVAAILQVPDEYDTFLRAQMNGRIAE